MALVLSEASCLGRGVERANRSPRSSLQGSPSVPGTCCGEQQWSLTRSWRQRCPHPGWSGPACPGHSGTWLGDYRHTEGQGPDSLSPKPHPSGTQEPVSSPGSKCPFISASPVAPKKSSSSRDERASGLIAPDPLGLRELGQHLCRGQMRSKLKGNQRDWVTTSDNRQTK